LSVAQGEARRSPTGFYLAGALVLLAALALRIMAARGELWLDEIWSLNLLTLASSPLDIFWRLTHDNNHHLNSLYLYYLGDDASVLARRSLAIGFGVAGVAMAGLIGLRRGRSAALITMGLMALSYPMIHYSSEARGYGPMMFFVLLAFYGLEGFLNERRMAYSWLFALAISLGFLSHMTIVFACLAFGLWGTVAILWDAATARQAMKDFLRCFAPVILLGGAVLAVMFAGALVNGFFIGGGRIIAVGDHFIPFVSGTSVLLQLELGLPFSVDPVLSGARPRDHRHPAAPRRRTLGLLRHRPPGGPAGDAGDSDSLRGLPPLFPVQRRLPPGSSRAESGGARKVGPPRQGAARPAARAVRGRTGFPDW
jgi:hypothetical protein